MASFAERAKILNFKFNLSFVFCYEFCFDVNSKSFVTYSRSWEFSTLLSSRSVIVLPFMCRSVIFVELIFIRCEVWNWSYGSFSCLWMYKHSGSVCWKHSLPSIGLLLHLLLFSYSQNFLKWCCMWTIPRIYGCFSGFGVYLIWILRIVSFWLEASHENMHWMRGHENA